MGWRLRNRSAEQRGSAPENVLGSSALPRTRRQCARTAGIAPQRACLAVAVLGALDQDLFADAVGPSFRLSVRSKSSLSGRVDQHVVKGLVAFFVVVIGLLLALKTEWGPRYGGKPLRADLLLAVHAHPERTVFYATKC